MNTYLTISIMGISAIALIVIAVKILLGIKKIAEVGIETEGAIIRMDLERPIDPGSYARYPVVKFLTNKNVWITKTSKIGVIPGMYKIGRKVKVVYQPNAPHKFIIKDNVTYVVPIAMLIIGAILVSFATFQLIIHV